VGRNVLQISNETCLEQLAGVGRLRDGLAELVRDGTRTKVGGPTADRTTASDGWACPLDRLPAKYQSKKPMLLCGHLSTAWFACQAPPKNLHAQTSILVWLMAT
jgi:hypothetical protein